MDYILGQDWEIVPAGGATGKAFFAQHQEQKLFLKRNSSPFLAVLSAEGIVPRLVWTKRLENGDVITAQQWLSGRVLNSSEMNDQQVAIHLRKIHRSEALRAMLSRLGKSPLQPENFYNMIIRDLAKEFFEVPSVKAAMEYLKLEVQNVKCDEHVVCHCDINHNNWLLTDVNQLYLIDWDGAMIADPAIDLGLLLYSYIPKSEWNIWLEHYGIELTEDLMQRMKWYMLAQTLTSIQWHKKKSRLVEMQKLIDSLTKIL